MGSREVLDQRSGEDVGASTAEIDEEIRRVARPTSWSDARRRLGDFARRNAFEHAVHLALSPRGRGNGGPVFVTTYPQAWIERYHECRYFALDPVLAMARRSRMPFHWADLDREPPEIAAFFAEAAEMGVGRHGLTIPIHGPEGEKALFSVTSNRSEAEFRAQCADLMPLLQILGFEFHRGLTDLIAPPQMDRSQVLSPRERDVLYWAASGKTVWETAQLLGITEDTTNSYLRDAIRRLSCLNKPHAVAEAVRLGLV